MKTQKQLFATFAFLLISVQLFAGWVITSEVDEEIGNKEIEITYIQNNKIKIATDKDIAIFNLETDYLYLINPKTKSYWEGQISDFRSTVIEGMKSQMETALKNVPAEHQEMYKQKYMAMIEKIEGNQTDGSENIKINKTDDMLKIVNYNTIKYQIFQNEDLREEVWITDELNLSDELNFDKFKSFFMSFSKITSQRTVENSPEFFDLFASGYPLKSIEYHENFKTITTAVSVEKKQIPDSEFLVPADFNKISIMDLWNN